jgi:hypothetical protein
VLCFSTETRSGSWLCVGFWPACLALFLAPSLRLQFVCWCLGLFVA